MPQPTYKSFKLIEFNVKDIVPHAEHKELDESNESDESDDSDETECYGKQQTNKKEFIIQMFGINEHGKTCSVLVRDYTPFFYIKVPYNWSINNKLGFLEHVKISWVNFSKIQLRVVN